MAENQTDAHDSRDAAESHAETAAPHASALHASALLTDAVPLNMAKAKPAVRPCTMAAALDLIGEKWSLLALRELGYGVNRFNQIAAYTGASRDILADRLRKLEASGLVEKRPYSEHPPRHEYHLTQAGRELFPVTISMLTWGEKWAVDAPSVVFRHTCGRQVLIDLECRHCGEPVTRESLTPVKGVAPGR